MCTVSWSWQAGGYELFFNRDELRSRRRAAPPAERSRGGTRYLAPADGDFGGTWIAANEHGLTLGLLNRAPLAPPAAREFESRGLLVTALADAAGWTEVAARLEARELARLRPFTLLVLPPPEAGERGARLAIWDGRALGLPAESPEPPLCSSARDLDLALRLRRRVLQAAPDLMSFHRSHLPERGPYSPCMHRDDAATVSFTHVAVSPESVTMTYADGPPCATSLGQPSWLERRVLAAAGT